MKAMLVQRKTLLVANVSVFAVEAVKHYFQENVKGWRDQKKPKLDREENLQIFYNKI